MSEIQLELKKWISDICCNNQVCEQKLRNLLLQDKNLVRNINLAYCDRNVLLIQKLIKNFITEQKVTIRTCRYCNKLNFISGRNFIEINCEYCHQPLFGLLKREAQKKENPKHLQERRLCIYCSKPVSSLSKSITCYSCKNVSFNVYP